MDDTELERRYRINLVLPYLWRNDRTDAEVAALNAWVDGEVATVILSDFGFSTALHGGVTINLAEPGEPAAIITASIARIDATTNPTSYRKIKSND